MDPPSRQGQITPLLPPDTAIHLTTRQLESGQDTAKRSPRAEFSPTPNDHATNRSLYKGGLPPNLVGKPHSLNSYLASLLTPILTDLSIGVPCADQAKVR